MREEPLDVQTAAGKLSGTLALPDRAPPWNLVLLVGGAGPTDRDGASLVPGQEGVPMKALAHDLARAGIASLRYDKRGVGGSVHPGLREEDLRFRHLVDDAVALMRRLEGDARWRAPVLLGHSEGALIAALAARDSAARAVAYVCGAGEKASALMRAQLQGRLPEVLELPALAMLELLEAEHVVAEPPEALSLLFRPSLQPYLVSWFRYDPAEVLEDLDLPLLLVHGGADAPAAAGAERLRAARPDARWVRVEGMDHALAVGGNAEGGVGAVAEGVTAFVRSLEIAAIG
ncbi:lysophospholipase [Ramlibacter sp. XY19]|uniref:alpha/beta hydrolase n=1 Tax=Ramlibacter paludis TaxID=2908000 RepID=UPI0023DC64EC|nr:alpha/beta fold hydrolase [Ramlibacter paludis]MCG2593078.1 lysophospholipase [Ramlibacter paludis]